MKTEIIIKTTPIYDKWFESLKDRKIKDRIYSRFDRLLMGNFGGYKQVDINIFELRFFFGSGIRIYFTKQNDEIIILLSGGNKSSQKKDIARAKEILKEIGG